MGALGPTYNSMGAHGEVNHNTNSKLNNASAHKRGNTGTESNCGHGVNFRNNRVPLRHHLPGFNFGGVGHIRCGTIGLSTVRTLISTGGLRGIALTSVVGTNLTSGKSLIGVLNGNRLASGISIRTGTFSGDTRTTVATTNNGTAGL